MFETGKSITECLALCVSIYEKEYLFFLRCWIWLAFMLGSKRKTYCKAFAKIYKYMNISWCVQFMGFLFRNLWEGGYLPECQNNFWTLFIKRVFVSWKHRRNILSNFKLRTGNFTVRENCHFRLSDSYRFYWKWDNTHK